jgi:hypothetical protein
MTPAAADCSAAAVDTKTRPSRPHLIVVVVGAPGGERRLNDAARKYADEIPTKLVAKYRTVSAAADKHGSALVRSHFVVVAWPLHTWPPLEREGNNWPNRRRDGHTGRPWWWRSAPLMPPPAAHLRGS